MHAIDGIILAGGPGERRLALLQGEDIVEFVIERFTASAGDILLGRVLSRPRDLPSAFIEIGDRVAGFLGSAADGLGEGDRIIVQVVTAARRDKGATLSARPGLAGSYLVYSQHRRGVTLSRQIRDEAARDRLKAALTPLLAPDEGVVARSLAPQAGDDELRDDLAQLRRQWTLLQQRAETLKPPARLFAPGVLAKLLLAWPEIDQLLVDDPALLPEARRLFAAAELAPDAWQSSGAADLFEQALERRVALPGGGGLIIDETEALTIIDIDGGALAHDQANRGALTEIARQLRLRAIAGHILIDLIPGGGRDATASLLDHLRLCLAADPTPTQIIGTTRLGLLELTRERRRPSLSELFLAPLRPRRSSQSLALEGLAAVLQAARQRPDVPPRLAAEPDVIHYLHSRPELIAEMADRLGRSLELSTRADLDGYEVVQG